MALMLSDFATQVQTKKSFTLEILPVPATRRVLEEDRVLELDEKIAEKVEKVSALIDLWAGEVTTKALKAFDCGDLKDKQVKDVQDAFLPNVEKVLEPYGLKVSGLQCRPFMEKVLPDFVKSTRRLSAEDRAEALKTLEECEGYLCTMDAMFQNKETQIETLVPKRILENAPLFAGNVKNITFFLQNASDDEKDEMESACPKLEEMGDETRYTDFLSQPDIDRYNLSVGGTSEEGKPFFAGYNRCINEINQRHKADADYTGPQFRILEPLYKQMFIPSEKRYLAEQVEDDAAAADRLKITKDLSLEALKRIETMFSRAKEDGVMVSGRKLYTLSASLPDCNERTLPDRVRSAERARAEKDCTGMSVRKTEKAINGRIRKIREKNYSFADLQTMIEETSDEGVFPNLDGDTTLWKVFCSQVIYTCHEAESAFSELKDAVLSGKIKKNRHKVGLIQNAFDAMTSLRDLIKPVLQTDAQNVDTDFYNEAEQVKPLLYDSSKAETAIRGYITRKPKDEARKIQTCLGDKQRFANRWWDGRGRFEKIDIAAVFSKGQYYLIMPAAGAKNIQLSDMADSNGDASLYLEYKLSKPEMMLPKYVFSGKNRTAGAVFRNHPDAEEAVLTEGLIEPMTIPRDVYDSYVSKTFTKAAVKNGDVTEEEQKQALIRIINTYKEYLAKAVLFQSFQVLPHLLPSEAYPDIKSFTEDVDKYTYNLSMELISMKKLMALAESGTLYVFQFASMQLRTGHMKRNTYSTLLTQFFSPQNITTADMILSARTKFYFRKAVIPPRVTHPVGSVLVRKRDCDGNPIPPDIYEAIYKAVNNIGTDRLSEAMEWIRSGKAVCHKAYVQRIKDRHYTEDKFLCTITYCKGTALNAADKPKELNLKVRDKIQNGCTVLAVVRSVDMLCGYYVMDQNGTILEKANLNVIDGTDYWKKLQLLGVVRRQEQREWAMETTTVKDLKDGYLRRAVGIIAQKAVQYRAVILVERLSKSFKDRWVCLDNQFFKKFELALAGRLADVSCRDVVDGDGTLFTGSLHLAAKMDVSTFEKIGQNGIMFFVKGLGLRSRCPESGFLDVLDYSGINRSVSGMAAFLAKFDTIRIQNGKLMFEMDLDRFKTKEWADLSQWKQKWTITVPSLYTEWNVREKKYHRYEDVVNEVLVPVLGKAKIRTNTNLADTVMKKHPDAETVSWLYKLFRSAAYGVIAQGTKKGGALYVSPIDGTAREVEEVIARNMADRFAFDLRYTGDAKSEASAWLAEKASGSSS